MIFLAIAFILLLFLAPQLFLLLLGVGIVIALMVFAAPFLAVILVMAFLVMLVLRMASR